MAIPALSLPRWAYKQKEFTQCWGVAVLVIALASPGFPQGFHFGVKAGVPMTEYFETGRSVGGLSLTEYSAATRRYTVGASTEWRFHRGLGFELDVLYKRMGYVRTVVCGCPPGPSESSFDLKGHSWDFPMLVKYRSGRMLHPYVAGGVVLRHIGPVRARGVLTETKLALVDNRLVSTTVTTTIDTDDPHELRDRNFAGLAIAVGVEFEHSPLRLLPEVRYTGWITNIGEARDLLRFDPNQVEFLLGFLF